MKEKNRVFNQCDSWLQVLGLKVKKVCICNAHTHTNDVENSINEKLVMQTRVGAGVWNMEKSQQPPSGWKDSTL